jgi:KUP system potassium uptake protein
MRDRQRMNTGTAPPRGQYLAALSIGALGVVYGDIGTSPLYALRESFLEEHGVTVSTSNVLGVLSLITWSLIIVISIKYLVFVLRADNRGEGGILALTSLITPIGSRTGGRRALILLGLFGTALLYGDGMITPAISVLSAVEGLGVATPVFDPYIVPITVAILIGIFVVQRHGTARVGRVFGPVTLLWFATLSLLGITWILREPSVLAALNPLHGLRFFLDNGWRGFLVLGSVFLVVTGGEALYADMGHFGTRPIRLAWFVVVLPALLLNYFGQGALVILRPAAIENPFYHMAPAWALYPVVAIATAATIIASQALISGAFSLTMQAVQMGYSPRVEIEHTSELERGQIYIPIVNWGLMVSCIALVIGFRSATNLAAAYGVAVTTTMVVTTLLFYLVARERWGWRRRTAGFATALFLAVDAAFWAANILKVPHGGWFPLLVGLVIFTVLTTWKKGRRTLSAQLESRTLPRDLFMQEVRRNPPTRVPGTAVFMYSSAEGTPPALLHSLKHYRVLHERLLFLSVQTADVPFVEAAERATITPLSDGIYQVIMRPGFMQSLNIPSDLAKLHIDGHRLKPMETTYFLGRETLIAGRRRREMSRWRIRLFILLARNARSAGSFFGLPPNRVVELGAQIEI